MVCMRIRLELACDIMGSRKVMCERVEDGTEQVKLELLKEAGIPKKLADKFLVKSVRATPATPDAEVLDRKVGDG